MTTLQLKAIIGVILIFSCFFRDPREKEVNERPSIHLDIRYTTVYVRNYDNTSLRSQHLPVDYSFNDYQQNFE